jgi:hypothetical protein
MTDIMTKQVFLPLVNHNGQNGVFQYVQDEPPVLTERVGKKLVLVEAISQYRMRYVVECDEVEHAADEVVMERVTNELSQLHLGEVITSTREINTEEYLRMFDEDNDYLRSWPLEKKLEMIHSIDYEN